MTPAPTLYDTAACADLVARSLAVCAELTERLLDLPDDSPRNPAADYHLLGRGMRQAILLLERLATKTQTDPAACRTAARAQIIRDVEDAIRHHARNRDPDELRAELIERLDRLDTELGRRPTPELTAELCRDLHLITPFEQNHYRRRTPADIDALQAQAAAPTGQSLGQTRPNRSNQRPLDPPIPRAPKREPPAAQTPRRPPLSTPSLMIPYRLDPEDYPEAHQRDQR